MKEKRYTSGEIAAAVGLTIRTIQHYDNIGLLRSAGRTEGGRRYYTQEDLIRLEKIVLYKSLDFSLDQIQEQILFQPGQEELQELFKKQQFLLLQKMEHLHTSFVVLGIMSDMIRDGRELPLATFLNFLSALPGDDIFLQASQMMTKEQKEMLSLRFQNVEMTQQFYHRWKEMMIEAVVLLSEGRTPESPKAQELAKRWREEIIFYTGGDPALIKQLSELRLEDQMTGGNLEMLSFAKRFMEEAMEIFSVEQEVDSKMNEDCEKGWNEDDTINRSDEAVYR